MSQRTENQVTEMKKQTIGVEVEMNSRRVLRNGTARKHRKPQRLLHLVGMGCRRTGMEVPEGCQYRRTGKRKV